MRNLATLADNEIFMTMLKIKPARSSNTTARLHTLVFLLRKFIKVSGKLAGETESEYDHGYRLPR